MLFNLLGRKILKNKSDDELVLLIKAGNSAALGEIYKRYELKVYGVCLKYMKNATIAQDIMMVLFENLSEKIKKQDIKNFNGWLYQVSKNECLMELRKKKQYFEQVEGLPIAQEETIPLAELKESKQLALEVAISELKDDQKRCVELFYLKDKSYKEIEEELKLPIKKVKSFIQNGKRNLKLILEQNPLFSEH